MDESLLPEAAPDETALRAAALAYLARYAATEAGVRRLLERRIERWARAARNAAPDQSDRIASEMAEARRNAVMVAASIAASGAVNDAAFAESRARTLQRAGRSRRAILAHLAAKGIDREVAVASLSDSGDAGSPDAASEEVAAALVLARRRRIGPFRATAAEPEHLRRELAILARAGFPRETAEAALGMETDRAETLVNALRRG